MLVECIFEDVQFHCLVEVLEEDFSQVVTFADDDGIFCIQIAETGKSRAEHGVCRYISETAFFVKFLQSGLYRSNVTDDAVLRQYWQHLAEGVQCVFHRSGIDDQFRLELLDFLQCSEAVGVVDKTQLVRVDIEHSRLVLETQYICKERAHFPGSKYKYSHDV